MTPPDYSKTTFEELQAQLSSLRSDVYLALLEHGPCTTRELAWRSGIDLLTVRPRVTELMVLCWVELADPDAPGREGIYRALSETEALAVLARRRADAGGRQVQGELSLI